VSRPDLIKLFVVVLCVLFVVLPRLAPWAFFGCFRSRCPLVAASVASFSVSHC
jgi:hypothetical protein